MPRIIPLIPPSHNPTAEDHETGLPEKIELYMPSSIPAVDRSEYCDTGLVDMEAELRYAAALDALSDLRRQLQLRTYLYRLKRKNVTGQNPNTRAQSMVNTVNARVDTAASNYRASRKAYLLLKGPGKWEDRLKVLTDVDIVGLGERMLSTIQKEDEEVTRTFSRGFGTHPDAPITSGESRRQVSWLWYTRGLISIDTDGDSTMVAEMNEGKPFYFVIPWINLMTNLCGTCRYTCRVAESTRSSATMGGGDSFIARGDA